MTTAVERNCAIQPSLKTARARNTTPAATVIAATKDAVCDSPLTPAASAALAATAASAALGPIEICRLVPKTA